MKKNRREFLKQSTAAGLLAAGVPALPRVISATAKLPARATRIGVSTYSFWRFNGPKEETSIESCIDQAAAMGFDGVEILHVQMTSEENGYLQDLKRRAFFSRT